MKKFLALLVAACVSMLATATPSSAAILLFKASDYDGGNHGLWVNSFRSGPNRFFSFEDDVYLTVDTDAGTGTFTGTAINPLGEEAEINISLTGFLETTNGSGLIYKVESGGAYDSILDSPDIDFFSGGSGTITIDGNVFNLDDDPFRNNTAFQYGPGANAKDPNAFGGSAWLNIKERPEHWDLNFNLTAVPEPQTWMLMILGFGFIGGAMRAGRRKPRMSAAFG